MALVLADNVKEATSTTGLADFTPAGAISGYQTFAAAIGNGNTTYYSARDNAATPSTWETGIGTVNTGTGKLIRTLVLGSSNAGAKVNFVNAPTLWCDAPAALLSNISGRNRIIDGAMYSDQVNGGASVPITGASLYVTDLIECSLFNQSTQTAAVQQVADAPAGFEYSIKYTLGGVGAAPGASCLAYLRYAVEGSDCIDLNFGSVTAKSITLSFWVKSSVTGTFGVGFENQNFNRSYVASYTINSANAWEYKTITIPGDVSGVWSTGNTVGLFIYWDIGLGTTYCQAPGAWSAGNTFGLTGGTKLVATTGATFNLTGAQLEAGSIATPFEIVSEAVRSAGISRFLQVYNYTANGIIANGGCGALTTNANAFMKFPPMRVPPSITLPSAGQSAGDITFLNGNTFPTTTGAHTVNGVTVDGFYIGGNSYVGLTAYGTAQIWVIGGGNAKFVYDARM